MTREELETAVMEEYQSLVGKIVLVGSLDGYKGEDFQSQVLIPEAVLGRILETDRFSVLRWMEDDLIDPIYNIEILTRHPELDLLDSTFVYGRTRQLDGSIYNADFAVPSDDLLAQCTVEGGYSAPTHKVFELTLPGFDGGDDDTDHLVVWVSAPERLTVEQAIEGTDARYCGEVAGNVEAVDHILPAGTIGLRRRIREAEKALEAPVLPTP